MNDVCDVPNSHNGAFNSMSFLWICPKIWRVDERTSGSDIGRDDFFPENFFALLIFIFFKFQFVSCVKRKLNLASEQQKCKGYENCDGLLTSKMKFSYQIFEPNKKISYWSSFLKLG